MFLVLAHRPDEFRAFFAYHDALMDKPGNLTQAEREMIVVATSNLNQCQYCVVAHGVILRIRANGRFADAVNSSTDKVRVLPADSLYLAWMDCRALGLDAEQLDRFMLTRARLWLDKGQKFGLEGHGYMRVNLGCPRTTVDEAIRRLTTSLADL